MISVERSVYDEYCKALMEIYGKDYATGKPAEGFVDAIGNMEKSAPEQVLLDSSDDEDIIVSSNETQTVESVRPLKKVKRENVSKRKGGKKEHESASSSELVNLQAFMKDMNVHLSTMASVMSRADEREQQITEKSEKVLEVLLSLEGVTPHQAFQVAQILTAQPHKLLIFFQCPDAFKGIYVKSLLGGNDGDA